MSEEEPISLKVAAIQLEVIAVLLGVQIFNFLFSLSCQCFANLLGLLSVIFLGEF